MHAKTGTTLEKLRLAIHGVTAPFSCAGTVAPKKPVTFVFQDQTRFEISRAEDPFTQEQIVEPLLDHCAPAPFGHGKKTRYNRKVRDALQLKAEAGGFSIEGFDPESAGILEKVQRELVPHDPNPISAELYSVNVYAAHGHFAPHKDTPRGDDMLGTLVVCLPSQFLGGKLVLSHRGVVQKYDWETSLAKQQDPSQLHWAAFFGDVDHQIETVWQGARVTLTYLLRRGRGTAPGPAVGSEALALAPRIQEAWQALLADRTFLPGGGILGYPCCHLYHLDARFQTRKRAINQQSSTMLKGRDHLVAATALQVGLKVNFNAYMFENCADETWQLNRFPTDEEECELGWQVDSSDLENALPIRASSEQEGDFGVTWLEPHPSTDESTWQSNEGRDPELPAAAHLHRCDYCPWGYFGNESSEVDLYTFAALHIQIPEFGHGPRSATSRPTTTKGKRKRSTRHRNSRQA
jgi:hypothetical protein